MLCLVHDGFIRPLWGFLYGVGYDIAFSHAFLGLSCLFIDFWHGSLNFGLLHLSVFVRLC